jgi:ADP-ribose pyrophosphatase YjhB (NUDIX family)
MPTPIHLTVAAVIYREGRYLLVREQIEGVLVYNQPAGHVEAGENFSSAMLREALEETGHEVELTGLLGLSTYHSPSKTTYYRVSFVARLLSDEARKPLDPEIVDTAWLTYDEIKTQPNLRSPMVLSDIDRHKSGEIFPLELLRESEEIDVS